MFGHRIGIHFRISLVQDEVDDWRLVENFCIEGWQQADKVIVLEEIEIRQAISNLAIIITWRFNKEVFLFTYWVSNGW